MEIGILLSHSAFFGGKQIDPDPFQSPRIGNETGKRDSMVLDSLYPKIKILWDLLYPPPFPTGMHPYNQAFRNITEMFKLSL